MQRIRRGGKSYSTLILHKKITKRAPEELSNHLYHSLDDNHF